MLISLFRLGMKVTKLNGFEFNQINTRIRSSIGCFKQILEIITVKIDVNNPEMLLNKTRIQSINITRTYLKFPLLKFPSLSDHCMTSSLRILSVVYVSSGMDLTYLRNILSDLKLRFDSKYSSNAFQLKRELLLLNRNEKSLIKKKVLRKNFDLSKICEVKLE